MFVQTRFFLLNFPVYMYAVILLWNISTFVHTCVKFHGVNMLPCLCISPCTAELTSSFRAQWKVTLLCCAMSVDSSWVTCPLFCVWITCNCLFFNINWRVSSIIVAIMIPTIMTEQLSTIATASPLLKDLTAKWQTEYVHEMIKLAWCCKMYRYTSVVHVCGYTVVMYGYTEFSVVFVNSSSCPYRF